MNDKYAVRTGCVDEAVQRFPFYSVRIAYSWSWRKVESRQIPCQSILNGAVDYFRCKWQESQSAGAAVARILSQLGYQSSVIGSLSPYLNLNCLLLAAWQRRTSLSSSVSARFTDKPVDIALISWDAFSCHTLTVRKQSLLAWIWCHRLLHAVVALRFRYVISINPVQECSSRYSKTNA